jgi:ankyrin repeat protein
LFFASYAGDRENVEQLKAAGADINRRMLVLGQFPVTPLLGAVWYGYTGLVTDLVRAGADVNDADADGMTGLHWAVLVNRPEMAETLIQAGAKVNPTDSFGYTPALYAATIDYGDTEMLELLIRRGADLKAKGKDGHTALANARRYRHEEIGRVLETAGARD